MELNHWCENFILKDIYSRKNLLNVNYSRIEFIRDCNKLVIRLNTLQPDLYEYKNLKNATKTMQSTFFVLNKKNMPNEFLRNQTILKA